MQAFCVQPALRVRFAPRSYSPRFILHEHGVQRFMEYFKGVRVLDRAELTGGFAGPSQTRLEDRCRLASRIADADRLVAAT